jgi:alkyl sulfatase BDS1-like metallo-beta-lactamase superfamily hydrolase
MLRANALRQLASKETSANGRNWYLTAALVTEGFDLKISQDKKIKAMSMHDLFQQMTVMVNPLRCEGVEETVHFNFMDTKEDFLLKVNNLYSY